MDAPNKMLSLKWAAHCWQIPMQSIQVKNSGHYHVISESHHDFDMITPTGCLSSGVVWKCFDDSHSHTFGENTWQSFKGCQVCLQSSHFKPQRRCLWKNTVQSGEKNVQLIKITSRNQGKKRLAVDLSTNIWYSILHAVEMYTKWSSANGWPDHPISPWRWRTRLYPTLSFLCLPKSYITMAMTDSRNLYYCCSYLLCIRDTIK